MLKRSVCAKRLVLVCGLFFMCFAPAIAQGMEFSFSNELSSDIVNMSIGDNAFNIEFPGIQDELIVEMTSKRVDFGVDVVMAIDLTGLSYNINDFDWYAAFRPVSVFEIGFSKDYYLPGSYLYVEDDNVAGAKMGSDGLSFVFLGDDAGVPGLKVGLTVPLDFDGEVNPFTSKFNFGFGAEYTFKKLFIAVGAAATNILTSDRVISVSASYFPIKGLEIYAGYSFNDQEGLCDVYGTHLMNASVAYNFDRFCFGFDFLTNFGVNTGSDYDLYAALYGEFRVIDPLLVFLTLTEQGLFDDMGASSITISPGVELDTFIGAFSLEVEVGLANGGFDYVCFPLSWIYEF